MTEPARQSIKQLRVTQQLQQRKQPLEDYDGNDPARSYFPCTNEEHEPNPDYTPPASPNMKQELNCPFCKIQITAKDRFIIKKERDMSLFTQTSGRVFTMASFIQALIPDPN